MAQILLQLVVQMESFSLLKIFFLQTDCNTESIFIEEM